MCSLLASNYTWLTDWACLKEKMSQSYLPSKVASIVGRNADSFRGYCNVNELTSTLCKMPGADVASLTKLMCCKRCDYNFSLIGIIIRVHAVILIFLINFVDNERCYKIINC